MGNSLRCSVPTRPSQPCGEANGPRHTGWCLGTIVGSGLREGRHGWKVTMAQERLPGKGCSHGTLQCCGCQPGRKRRPRREESCGRGWPIGQAKERCGSPAGGSQSAWELRAGEGGCLCPAAMGTFSRPLVQAHAYQMGLSLGSPGIPCVVQSGREESTGG